MEMNRADSFFEVFRVDLLSRRTEIQYIFYGCFDNHLSIWTERIQQDLGGTFVPRNHPHFISKIDG